MNKKISFFTFFAISSFAGVAEQYQNQYQNFAFFSEILSKEYSNSKQKDKGDEYKLGFEGKMGFHSGAIAYQYANTDTFQPPLKEDLKIDKVFLKYGYKVNNNFTINIKYIGIDDNISPTDDGKIYGAGLIYSPTLQTELNVAHFLSDYPQFNVNQSDFGIKIKQVFRDFGEAGEVKTNFSIGAKYIRLLDYKDKEDLYTKNAKDSYFTPEVSIMANYGSYLAGMNALFGKRVFAVMNGGEDVQHHAMEMKKTYGMFVGKQIGAATLMVKYSFQVGKELPQNNDNVDTQTVGFGIKYNF